MAEPLGNPGLAVGTVRMLWAGLLLTRAQTLLSASGLHGDRAAEIVARILGGRQALQGLVEITTGTRWRKAGTFVDISHALTALGLAVISRRWRNVALLDALIAGSFAAAGRRTTWRRAPY